MDKMKLPVNCPNCMASAGFMHMCDCTALDYVHVVCDACNTAFKPTTLTVLADPEAHPE